VAEGGDKQATHWFLAVDAIKTHVCYAKMCKQDHPPAAIICNESCVNMAEMSSETARFQSHIQRDDFAAVLHTFEIGFSTNRYGSGIVTYSVFLLLFREHFTGLAT
jgi:hypothetical protein